MLRPTKGVHIVLPEESLGKKHAFVLTAKSDDRVFFSLPWFGRTLVGTTDTDYDPAEDGPLEDIRASQNEVDYLMESVKRTFPGASVSSIDVQSSFAGVRPLVAEGKGNDPSAVSREHRIWQDPSGLFTVAGGKYTTYRVMAAQLLDFVIKRVGHEFAWSPKPVATAYEPLVLPLEAKEFGHLMDEYNSVLDRETITHLQYRYGARWQRVADIAVQDKSKRERIIGSELDILAEAAYAKECEMAVSVEDFLRRRTMLALKAPLARHLDRVQLVADLFAAGEVSAEQVSRWQGLEWK
jgi:glycerol-3-phosphate dehydrogenase